VTAKQEQALYYANHLRWSYQQIAAELRVPESMVRRWLGWGAEAEPEDDYEPEVGE
jgi:DNA-directed RNA polymerase specialized sigma24 family protein